MDKGAWRATVHGVARFGHDQAIPGGSDGKASAYNAGDPGSIPGLGRSSGEGNGTPLQYSCLENPMGRGAWWATVYGVAKSRTRLSDFTFFTFTLATKPPLSIQWDQLATFFEEQKNDDVIITTWNE